MVSSEADSVKAYSVADYSEDVLLDALCVGGAAEHGKISAKHQYDFLKKYFAAQNAATIVVEHRYVDRHFLEDYAGFYVRCLHRYDRYCRRLHFFCSRLSASEVAAVIDGSKDMPAAWREDYLGFVVVRPLPQTIIGRTCLRPYPNPDGHRHYRALRRYEANFFGVRLSVSALAFQEQDTDVAACATSAIWSALHATSHIFDHAVPAPVAITGMATESIPSGNRAFPNNSGLSVAQMMVVLKRIGLEPIALNIEPALLVPTCYAYLEAGIPSILVIQAPNGGQEAVAPNERHALHAIAVGGYSLKEEPPAAKAEATDSGGQTPICLLANRIDGIFAHDDRIGPFAHYSVSSANAWRNNYEKRDYTPYRLIVPLYHKIRIPFDRMHLVVQDLDKLVRHVADGAREWFDIREICWDISLATVTGFREDIRRANELTADQRHEIVTGFLPRFIWRVSCFVNGAKDIELLFDATDILQGNWYLQHINWQEDTGAGFHISGAMKLLWKYRSHPVVRKRFSKVKEHVALHVIEQVAG